MGERSMLKRETERAALKAADRLLIRNLQTMPVSRQQYPVAEVLMIAPSKPSSQHTYHHPHRPPPPRSPHAHAGVDRTYHA